MQEIEKPRTTDAVARENRIRAHGPVPDLHFAQSLYKPLLKNQRRDGVEVSRDISYGTDPRHRLDIYTPGNGIAAHPPVMIFIPGGGFIRGDKKADRENIGQRLLEKA